ncbi:MAG TPA: hypothetical protein VGO59_11890 [Verrucomicrobiae bacterium]|jgi:hypothetical protein
MTSALPNGSWTRKRFLGWAAVLFAFQAGLIFLFGDRARPRPRKPPPVIRFHALQNSVDESELLRRFFVGDPAVFALPNHHDFSGRAWMDQRPLAYVPENQFEPPQWLSFAASLMGARFPFPAVSNEAMPAELSRQPEQREELPPAFLPPEIIPSRSVFRLEGALGGRLLGGGPSLKAQPSDKILKASAVQIAVGATGEVMAARLDSTCGSSEADANAVARALGLRFRPAPSAGTQWGEAIFQWQTAEPPVTSPPK